MHGRGVTRAETIRALPVFRAAGYSVLLASWRNDGVAPKSVDGPYGLGSTEWEDVDAALRWVEGQGATSVVLMGWSMGGAVVLQTLVRSPFAQLVDGVVLESAVVDWHAVLKSQSRALRLPRVVRKVAQRVLRTPVLHRLAGLAQPGRPARTRHGRAGRGTHRADPAAAQRRRRVRALVGSHALAEARPDLVRLEVAHAARHTKLWNHDADWFDATHPGVADRGGPAARRDARPVAPDVTDRRPGTGPPRASCRRLGVGLLHRHQRADLPLHPAEHAHHAADAQGADGLVQTERQRVVRRHREDLVRSEAGESLRQDRGEAARGGGFARGGRVHPDHVRRRRPARASR